MITPWRIEGCQWKWAWWHREWGKHLKKKANTLWAEIYKNRGMSVVLREWRRHLEKNANTLWAESYITPWRIEGCRWRWAWWHREQVQFIDAWHQIWKLCDIHVWTKTSTYEWVYLFAIYVLYLCTEEAWSSSNCLDHDQGTMDSRTWFVYCIVWWLVIHMYEWIPIKIMNF